MKTKPLNFGPISYQGDDDWMAIGEHPEIGLLLERKDIVFSAVAGKPEGTYKAKVTAIGRTWMIGAKLSDLTPPAAKEGEQ